METMFSLTDAGRRANERPGFDSNTEEMRAVVAMMESGAEFSFDDIIRLVPGEMYRVLQAMATGMAMGLLEAKRQATDNRMFGHGHW